MRQHRAETQAQGAMDITLLALRWARARDARLAVMREKKVCDALLLRMRAKGDVSMAGDILPRSNAADHALAVARRDESRAKRQLLAACKGLQQRQQSDVIDV
ncbi:hypothetical protein CDEN61S_04140 [Castellaniella denitrificans]